VFQLALKFPKDYPMAPPELKFVSDFWHPNVFANGKVCMSILHPPGEDAMSGELPEERWLPTQSVTTIILSLLSLLNDPNCASPANVDASVEWRNHRDTFKSRCRKLVEKANAERPAHVVIPHPESDADQHKRRVQKFHEMNKDLDYEDFYNEVEADDDEEDGDDNNESGDDLSDSDEEINTDDEGSPKVPPKEVEKSPRTSETSTKGEVVVTEVVAKPDSGKEEDVKGKGKATESAERNDEEVVASTTKASAVESVQPSASSSSNPSPPPQSTNNNSLPPPHAKKAKGKKGKKCIIM
jgi:ubiquitin-conjugating enzyme E2 R